MDESKPDPPPEKPAPITLVDDARLRAVDAISALVEALELGDSVKSLAIKSKGADLEITASSESETLEFVVEGVLEQ
jgi:hypothetical protein